MSFKETEFGLIPEVWEIHELRDKVEITMGQSPKSEFYNSDGEGIPFMQGRTTFGEKYHSIDTWCTDPKKYAKKNDVLMSVRAPVGDVNVAKTDLCIGRGLASLRMKNGNNEFLYYLLKNYVNILVSRQSGTIFGSINKAGLENLKLPFPIDAEQKAIAHILSTLDEKIKVNNQINKTLEAMAQAIFKQWFVDFEFPNEEGEPYKSSGGEMVESELGMIPKGWGVGTVTDMGDVIGGATPSKKREDYFTSNGIPWITPKDLSDNKNLFISRGLLDITNEGYNSASVKKMPSGTVLFSSRAPIGYIAIAKNEITTNQGFKSIVPAKDKGLSSEFIYCWLKENLETIENRASGSTFKEISGSEMKRIPAIIPTKCIISKFNMIQNNNFKEIEVKEAENEILNTIRDTLLPKLMSGEIRVPLEKEIDIS